jgi:hypothetical protein
MERGEDDGARLPTPLMAPVVSLDVLPTDIPALHAPAMVEACSGALTEGSCAFATELPESTSPEAVALVLWQGPDLTQVTVRVGRRGGQWFVRALTFAESDSVVDRWTTVGLTVATLAGETRTLQESDEALPSTISLQMTPVEHRRPTVDDPPSRPQRLTFEPKRQWLGSLGALVGTAWDRGEWQRGAWLTLTFRASRLPLQAHVLGSYAFSNGPKVADATAHTDWMTAGLGAGVYGSWSRLSLVGSAALELAYRRVETELDGREASDHELPLRLRAAASLPATGLLGATLGFLLRLPPHNPRGSEGSTLRAAALTMEAFAGLEVRL